jgi:hypothetical protein
VPDLSTLLGQDVQAEQLTAFLDSPACRVARLTGPPGSGKSYIARTVAQAWRERGHVVVVAEGDESNSWRALYPLVTGLSWTSHHWSGIARTGARSAVQVADTTTGGLGVGTTIFDLLSAVFRQRIERALRVYSVLEREVVMDVRRLARREQVLIVAENAHWWDADSLSLLGEIVSERLAEAIPPLQAVSVLQVDTAGYQTVLAPERFAGFVPLSEPHTVRTTAVSRDAFPEVLAAFGLSTSLPASVADAVYTATDGHLELAAQVALLVEHSGAHDAAAILSDDFVLRHMSRRLADLGQSSPDVSQLLVQAAVLGLSCEARDLTCLSGLTPARLAEMVERACELGLVERDGQRIAFAHDVIRSSLLSGQQPDQVRSLAAAFSRCLSILRPGDYESRAETFERAGDADEARDMVALAGVAKLRSGESLPRVVGWVETRRPADEPLGRFLDTVSAGYSAVADGSFAQALPDLRTPAAEESTRMAAERNYVASICLMEDQTTVGADRAAALLRSWLTEVSAEPEQHLRFLLLLQQAEVLADRFDEARATEALIERLLSARARHDPDAVLLQHIQNRRSAAINVPEIAVVRIRDSARYFERTAATSTRAQLELFRATTNLAAVELRLGRDQEALAHATDAERIAVSAVDSIPRIDVLAGNLVLAALRSGTMSAKDAVDRQQQVVESPEGQKDGFIHRCNLVAYQLLDRRDEDAQHELERLETELSAGELTESYLVYYSGCLNVAAAALRGDTGVAVDRHRRMDDLVASLRWPCAGYTRRRHQRIAELLPRLDTSMSRSSIDRILIDGLPDEVGPAWPYYGRFVLACELSFWSDS